MPEALKAACAAHQVALERSLASLLADFYGISPAEATVAVNESRDAALNKYSDNPEETKKRG